MKERRKILRVKPRMKEAIKEGVLKKLVSGIIPSPVPVTPVFLDSIKLDLIYCEPNDMTRLLSLMPHNCCPLIEGVINRSINRLSLWFDGEKRMATSVLQFFHTNWNYDGELEHLFLATCLLCPDKNAANLAGEVWIKYAPTGSLNNARIGQIIGVHERIEFAPLKRFTDLAMAQMFRVSHTHNRLLCELIENILMQLPDKRVKGSKKLVEIYEELVLITGSPRIEVVDGKLSKWKK